VVVVVMVIQVVPDLAEQVELLYVDVSFIE